MKKTTGMKTLACALPLSAALTMGASALSTVTAVVCPDVTISVDGVTRELYNAQGREVHPIIYNGTTYIPLRAVGELMGKNVSWDAATGTASVGGVRTTGAVVGTPNTAARRSNVTF